MQQRVSIEPYVAMAILDQHMRRPGTHVTGYLLGGTHQDVVVVRGFVPSLDPAYVELVQSAAPHDRAVGRYSTVAAEPDMAVVLKELTPIIDRPIYLVVAVPTLEAPTVSFRAFGATSYQLQGVGYRGWREMPAAVATLDPAVSVVVDTMCHLQMPTVARASDPAHIPSTTDSNDAFAELVQMRTNLAAVIKYCDEVTSGKRAGDKAVGRSLTSALAVTSVAKADATASVVEEKSNDALLLMYLARSVKQQVSVLQAHFARA